MGVETAAVAMRKRSPCISTEPAGRVGMEMDLFCCANCRVDLCIFGVKVVVMRCISELVLLRGGWWQRVISMAEEGYQWQKVRWVTESEVDGRK